MSMIVSCVCEREKEKEEINVTEGLRDDSAPGTDERACSDSDLSFM